MYHLRNWNASDIYALQNLCIEMKIPSVISVNTMLKLYQNANPSRFMYQAICHDNHVCGLIQAEKTTADQVEIGFWMQSAYRNQHILSNVLETFCEMVVTQLHAHVLYARVEASNTISRHVLLQHHFHKRHAYQNVIMVYQRVYTSEKA